jgi:RNA recognition motif-containing protein
MIIIKDHVIDKRSGLPTGVAYITFDKRADAEKALEEMDGVRRKERTIFR